MTVSHRRHFLQQTSLRAAALCWSQTRVIAAATRDFEGRAQDVAGTDAASIRRLASQISGHVITREMPDNESSRPSLQPRIRPTSGGHRAMCWSLRRRALSRFCSVQKICRWRCAAEATAVSGTECAMQAW